MGKIVAVLLSLLMAIPQPIRMTKTYAEDNTSENAVVETAEPTETAGSEQNMQDSLIVQDSGTDSPEAESTPAATSTAPSEDGEPANDQIAEQEEDADADADSTAQPAAVPRARAPIMRAASTSDLTGTAYAVLNSSTGELDFIRSTETHTNKSTGSVKSISGNTYTGTIYAGFETNSQPYTSSTWGGRPFPWLDTVNKVKSVKFIDVIRPLHCDYWFYNMGNCTDIDIAKLDTSHTTSMLSMFDGCSSLTSLNLESFDTSNVTDMQFMFSKCSSLKSLNVENFDTSNVTDMSSMFYDCSSLTSLDLKNFDTANVLYMDYMFSRCSSLTSLNLEKKFDTSNVANMQYMFSDCSSLTSLDVSKWDTANVSDMGYMFQNCSALTSLNVGSFNTSNVTDMHCMFFGCSSLHSLDVGDFSTANVTDMSSMFDRCSSLTSLNVGNFDTTNVTNMYSMFYGCSSLTSLDLENFNTANVTDMSYMFKYCSSLTSLDLKNFDTANVLYMDYMFSRCSSLASLDLGNFNTANVTSMGEMFHNCSSLKSLDLRNFDTVNVTSMAAMFSGCSSLMSLNVGNFNTANVQYMGYMFEYCSSLTSLDVKSFDTAKVQDMGYMFRNCSSLTSLDVGNFNTANVIGMDRMFSGCSLLSRLTFGAGFKVSSYSENAFPTPAKTYSSKPSTGQWGLGSEQASSSKTADELATYGATSGALNGTWYAQVDPAYITYSITYNLNGGFVSGNPTSYHSTSDTITLNNPTRTGYTFAGWTGSNGNTPQKNVTIQTGSTGNKSYTANWTPNTYKVTYDANGGSGSMSNDTATYGTSFTAKANGFTRPGYEFAGWTEHADGTGSNWTDWIGRPWTWTYTRSITLYAQWKAHAGTVTYNANGGSLASSTVSGWSLATDGTVMLDGKAIHTLNGPNGAAQSVAYDSPYNLVDALNPNYLNLARTGYHIDTSKEWNTKSDGTGTVFDAAHKYLAQELIPGLAAKNGAAVTVYANWKPNNYTIKFNANGGTGTMADEAMTYASSKALTANAFSRTGYDFAGWSMSQTATIKTYSDKQSVVNLTTTNNGTVTLYAVWVPHTYTITYNLNGGTVTGNPTTYNITNNAITLKNPARTGYVFAGWTGANGTTPQTSVTIAKGSTENKSYTANWIAHTITTTIDINGGTAKSDGSANPVVRGYDQVIDSTWGLADASHYTSGRTGYHATGLYHVGSPNGKITVKEDGQFLGEKAQVYASFIGYPIENQDQKVTLYADWQPNTYTIKYDANGGTGTMADSTATYDQNFVTRQNAFSRKGYTFNGWNTKADGTGTPWHLNGTGVYENGNGAHPWKWTYTQNITLYAQWTANTYTVSIPKAIKYDGMSIGKVNVGTSYDVTVKCKTGTFADTIEVSSSTSPMKAAGGSTDLSVTSDSSQTPLIFTKEGTQQDHVVISGTTTTADKWTGTIQYAVSEK